MAGPTLVVWSLNMNIAVRAPRGLDLLSKWLGLAALSLAMAGCSSTKGFLADFSLGKPSDPATSALAIKSDSTGATASMLQPIVEKRETFLATGYAVISVQPHKNAAQQRLMAIRASKLDAYRSLTEQVYGQQLDASTTVADMTIQSDTFRAKVEGVIYGAVLVSITPVGDDTYETTLSLDQSVVRDLRTLYLTQLASRRR
jgi:hypothetical protein